MTRKCAQQLLYACLSLRLGFRQAADAGDVCVVDVALALEHHARGVQDFLQQRPADWITKLPPRRVPDLLGSAARMKNSTGGGVLMKTDALHYSSH